MMAWETDRNISTPREPASVPDFLDFQQRTKTFQRLAAFYGTEVNLTPDVGEPSRLAALVASHEFLDLVGLKPLLGRQFGEAEDRVGGPRAALISADLWAQLYSRDPSVIGRIIRLDDVARTIVGVLPSDADFGSLQVWRAAAYGRGFAERGGRPRVDVWIPAQLDPAILPRSTHPIFVIGRLASG